MSLRLIIFVTALSSYYIVLFIFFRFSYLLVVNLPEFMLIFIVPVTVLILFNNLLLQNMFTVEPVLSRIHFLNLFMFSLLLLLSTSFKKSNIIFVSALSYCFVWRVLYCWLKLKVISSSPIFMCCDLVSFIFVFIFITLLFFSNIGVIIAFIIILFSFIDMPLCYIVIIPGFLCR